MSRVLARFVVSLALPCVVLGGLARAETVFFVSKTTGGLYSFDTAGSAITALSGTGAFDSPSALAFGPDGNLYVGDATGGGRIARYALATGSISTVVSLTGTNPAFAGSPVGPGAIAFRPAGQGGQMLVGRNPQTAFVGYPTGPIVSLSGWGIGETVAVQDYTTGTTLDHSPGLAVAPDGTLYVSNSLYNTTSFIMTGNIPKFDASGAYQSVVAADGSGSGGLFGPSGLGIHGTSLFSASTMNGNVYKTNLTNPDTATNTSLFASTGGDYIGPLAMLADGGMLVGSVSGPAGLIYRFDSAGQALTPFGGSAYGQIGGITVAPVPEPAAVTTAVLGIAIGATMLRRRRAGR